MNPFHSNDLSDTDDAHSSDEDQTNPRSDRADSNGEAQPNKKVPSVEKLSAKELRAQLKTPALVAFLDAAIKANAGRNEPKAIELFNHFQLVWAGCEFGAMDQSKQPQDRQELQLAYEEGCQMIGWIKNNLPFFGELLSNPLKHPELLTRQQAGQRIFNDYETSKLGVKTPKGERKPPQWQPAHPIHEDSAFLNVAKARLYWIGRGREPLTVQTIDSLTQTFKEVHQLHGRAYLQPNLPKDMLDQAVNLMVTALELLEQLSAMQGKPVAPKADSLESLFNFVEEVESALEKAVNDHEFNFHFDHLVRFHDQHKVNVPRETDPQLVKELHDVVTQAREVLDAHNPQLQQEPPAPWKLMRGPVPFGLPPVVMHAPGFR